MQKLPLNASCRDLSGAKQALARGGKRPCDETMIFRVRSTADPALGLGADEQCLRGLGRDIAGSGEPCARGTGQMSDLVQKLQLGGGGSARPQVFVKAAAKGEQRLLHLAQGKAGLLLPGVEDARLRCGARVPLPESGGVLHIRILCDAFIFHVSVT